MQIHPFYRANDEIKELLDSNEKYFAFQEVDTLFDKEWCYEVMKTISSTRSSGFVRSFYLLGSEIGNKTNPNIKYYVLFC